MRFEIANQFLPHHTTRVRRTLDISLEDGRIIAKVLQPRADNTVVIRRHEVPVISECEHGKIAQKRTSPLCGILDILLNDHERPSKLMEVVHDVNCTVKQCLEEPAPCIALYRGQGNDIIGSVSIQTTQGNQEEFFYDSGVLCGTRIFGERCPLVVPTVRAVEMS